MGKEGDSNTFFKANVGYSDAWMGAPLLPLPDLLHLGLKDFEGTTGPVRAVQATQLVQ